MGGWMDGQIYGWIDDRWIDMDGFIDRWMDG